MGQHVMKALKDRGETEIFSFSRREGVDIADFKNFSEKLKEVNPDVIINCAAHVGSVHYALEYSADMIRDNMQIVLNIYEGVKQVCPEAKIINPISNCSYPGNADIHYEPDWEKGAVHSSVLAYASVRRMIYAFAECYHREYDIKTVNWLIANAYGPGDHTDPNKVHALNGIIIRLLKAQKSGDKTFEIWGTGQPTREWVYIEDAARILIESMNINEQIYPLNFAQNKAYSITEIADIVAKLLSYPVTFTFNTKFPDGAPTKILDDRNFRQKYPAFEFTPLERGIKNTIEYYKNILN